MTTPSRRFPLYLQILAAVILGLVVGPLLGDQATPLGELGKLVIELVKATATPLLFFAIVHAIVTTEIQPRSGLRMLGIAAINTSIAVTIGLLISNLLQPGKSLAGGAWSGKALKSTADYANKRIDWVKTVGQIIPTNIIEPFAQSLILQVIVLALLTGFGLRRVRAEPGFRVIVDGVAALLKLMEVILGWVIHLIPLAVFGVLAKTVGSYGYEPLKGLAVYVAVALLGLGLHASMTYSVWIVWVGKMRLIDFWRNAKEAVITAIGTNSSLATLPVTLKALEKMGVSRQASTLGACVGTNLNNDGIVLYEGMAMLFVAQASGVDLTITQQILAAVTCMFAAMGVAGVPEAGFISLALVLNTLDLPVEILPLLLTVDWIIARGRSVVNVLSDMVLSIGIDRWGKAELAQPADSLSENSK